MKRFIALTFLFAFLLIPLTVDAQQKFTVSAIYFQPTNAPAPNPNLGHLMLDVQELYRSEMMRNDYGAKAFRLETDRDNNVIIHIVKGQHLVNHYRATTNKSIQPELPQKFLNNNIITVIVVGGLNLVNGRVWGVGFPIMGASSGGRVTLASESGHLNMRIIAHEMGHAFGLYHNQMGEPSILGGGKEGISNVNELDPFEARWLDKHHYFNPVRAINSVPEIIRTHPFKDVDFNVIRFRFDIQSRNLLYMALAFRGSDVVTVGWDILEGNHDTAEFLISRGKLANRQLMYFQVMDVEGNMNLIHVNVSNLPETQLEKRKKAILKDDAPSTDKPEKVDAEQSKLSISGVGKIILLWARIKERK